MKIAKLLLLFYFFSTHIYGQEVVSTQGDSYSNSSILLDFTIGEAVIETYSDVNTHLTQGFHQTSNLISTSISQIQNKKQEVVSTQGDSYSNFSILLDFTIGEAVIETYSDVNTHLTQGFHQTSNLISTSISQIQNKKNLSYRIIPNPTFDHTTITFSIPNNQSVKLVIYDSLGTLLSIIDKGNLNEGTYYEELTSLGLENGTYYISLITSQTFTTQPLIIIGK